MLNENRSAVANCALAVVTVFPLLVAQPARADQRDDFIAGHTKSCPGCDLSGLNFKRKDLSGAILSGARLVDSNFHDARLQGAKLNDADLTSILNEASRLSQFSKYMDAFSGFICLGLRQKCRRLIVGFLFRRRIKPFDIGKWNA